MMDDRKILDLFFARDENAIFETRRKYGAYMFTVASNILQNAQDAEECVNDAYFKAWEAMPPKRPAFLQGFLAKISRNHALDKYRAANAQKRGGSNVDVLLSELEEALPSPDDVHAAFENNLTAEAINHFLRGLKEQQRFIFMRRYWYADSISDIAKGLHISESKVKSILFRTRKNLKIFLEQSSYGGKKV
jgi:RNA polymerase sigma-70 factor (ECF subfamily)